MAKLMEGLEGCEVSHWVPKLTQPHFLKGPCHGDDGNSGPPLRKRTQDGDIHQEVHLEALKMSKDQASFTNCFSKPRRDLPSCKKMHQPGPWVCPATWIACPLWWVNYLRVKPILLECGRVGSYAKWVTILPTCGDLAESVENLWKDDKDGRDSGPAAGFLMFSCSLFLVFLEVDRCSCDLPGSQKNTPHFQELSSLSGRTLRFGAGGWENLTFRTKCLGSWETEKMEHLHSGNLT